MRVFLTLLLALGLTACTRSGVEQSPPAAPSARTAAGFPVPHRPVADVVAPFWSSGPDRDATDESGQLIRGLGISSGMSVADIGAGSGYHTLRLSPAVGPDGAVYAEDIVEHYISGLRREAARRGLTNVRLVVGKPDDPMLPAGGIDRAVLVHMYHEISNPYALLWNLAPAMKAGGLVGVIDLDRPTERHGTPPTLLECEFEAVGYRLVEMKSLSAALGYLAVFEPPAPEGRPRPADIEACASL